MRKLPGLFVALALSACDKKAPENPPAPTVVTTADTAQPATPDPKTDPKPEPAKDPAAADPAADPKKAEPAKDAVAPVAPGAPATDTTAKVEPDKAPTKVAGAKVERKPRQKLKKADQPQATEAYKAFRGLLDEGRKLVKDDKPEEGMKKMEEALTKVPGHPSALGELGWAAYRAGPAYFDKALTATRQALSVSKKNKQKGALWYNLGRISEDKGDLGLAVDAYRQSLAFRPGNDAVQKQLEGVIGKLGGKTVEDGLAKLDEVCSSVWEDWGCESVASAEGEMAHSCSCTHEIIGPEEGFGRAALMRLSGYADIGGTVDATYLVLEIAAKWHLVSMVGNDWSPGFGYVYNNSEQRRFSFRDIGGKKVLWVEYYNGSTDLDPGIYTEHNDSSVALTLCQVEGGAPSCWTVPLAAASSVSKMSLDDGEVPEGEGPTETSSAWALSADVVGSDIVIKVESGDLDSELKGLPGTYTMATIGSAPGVVKQEF